MIQTKQPEEKFRAVIAGDGVAALEAALALRAHGGDRMATTILASGSEFVYRPMTVGEPFAEAAARRYPLDRIADDIGAELRTDSFAWLDRDRHVVHTGAGEQLSYDALLLAPGARPSSRMRHALTVDDAHLDECLHGLILDIEDDYVHELAFLIPPGKTWPLPIYELALMTALRAYDTKVSLSITIVTPEDAPLAIFGSAASDGVRRLLEEKGIKTITSAYCEVLAPGRISIHPGSRELRTDRVVALPELVGPSLAGVPRARRGFIPVDPYGKVRGIERVFAAGDATDFAIKHGGIAAQQADVAAQSLAALAGVAPEPPPFHPSIHGMLLTGEKPLYLSAQVTGGHGSSSQITDSPSWSPGTKIAAKYLAPYLDKLDRETVTTR